MMAESTLFVFRSVLRICSYFNPRTPVGCDLLEISIRGNLVVISIHAPQWGATTCIFMLRHIFYISIHAPQWGATERDLVVLPDRVISIHAPQWGATRHARRIGCQQYISIHAPQWGATAADLCYGAAPLHFNPRTPVGCDQCHPCRSKAARLISIHAPQWGATKPTGDGWLTCIFQSTHPSGVRHYRQTAADLNALFQSTHPSGVRPPSCWPCRPSAAYFNPRTPVGCCFCSIGS